MYPFILTALLNTPYSPPVVEIYDSRDDKNITYVVVNSTCKVKIKKSELKDYDKIINVVMKKCGL